MDQKDENSSLPISEAPFLCLFLICCISVVCVLFLSFVVIFSDELLMRCVWTMWFPLPMWCTLLSALYMVLVIQPNLKQYNCIVNGVKIAFSKIRKQLNTFQFGWCAVAVAVAAFLCAAALLWRCAYFSSITEQIHLI